MWVEKTGGACRVTQRLLRTERNSEHFVNFEFFDSPMLLKGQRCRCRETIDVVAALLLSLADLQFVLLERPDWWFIQIENTSWFLRGRGVSPVISWARRPCLL